MTDPAAPARTAQHIEPEDKPMRIEVRDYAAPKPRPRYVDARPFAWLGIVAVIALFAAALIFAGSLI